jgi:hypothetical protein
VDYSLTVKASHGGETREVTDPKKALRKKKKRKKV